MAQMVIMAWKGIIWLFSAVLFGIPLICFSVVDWVLDQISGESRNIDARLGYWKPFEQ